VAEDVFKELDQELRAERLRQVGRRYGLLLLILVLLLLVGIGVWQYLAFRQRQAAEASAVSYFAGMKAMEQPPHGNPAQAAPLFARVVQQGPEGFRTLARFWQAKIDWDGGHTAQAIAAWDQISSDVQADPTLRGLATLLSVQHQMQSGDPALLMSRLGTLSHPGDPWRAMAQELDAELDLRLGRVAEARHKLQALSEDGAAPEGVRNRAAGLSETLEANKTGG